LTAARGAFMFAVDAMGALHGRLGSDAPGQLAIRG
jgi:hypothetical protein